MDKLKLMVSSTVLDKEDLLDQIYAMLESDGYHVGMNHKGTIFADPRKTTLENSLQAVHDHDIFLGIITSRYGTEVEDLSFSHHEMLQAIKVKKPSWFLVHSNVVVAWHLLRQFGLHNGKARADLKFQPTKVLDDIRVLKLYEDIVQEPGVWVQKYPNDHEALRIIKFQFQNEEQVRRSIQLAEEGR